MTFSVNIFSAQTSAPLFDFSLPKDVVGKAVYSLDDAAGAGDAYTVYYLFQKGISGWRYRYKTGAGNYYLNIL